VQASQANRYAGETSTSQGNWAMLKDDGTELRHRFEIQMPQRREGERKWESLADDCKIAKTRKEYVVKSSSQALSQNSPVVLLARSHYC
jgi:hypothetical protein